MDFTDLDQAMQFISSGEDSKCFDHVASGAEQIARFLQQASAKGEPFGIGAAAAQGAV